MSDEISGSDPDSLSATVVAAQGGDAVALEQLVLSVRDRVYRLSLRMTSCPADAEDAAQEILIRVITRLSTFRGEAAFSTWVHRIAVNYLLDRSKSAAERMELTFDTFALDLLDGLAASPSTAPDAAVLERELQLACTHAMLTCLDRDHRVAYILGEIFDVDSDDGGYITEIPPATYRKRLSRARRQRAASSSQPTAGWSARPPPATVRSGSMSRYGSAASTRSDSSSPITRRPSTASWSASTKPPTCSAASRRRASRPRRLTWSPT